VIQPHPRNARVDMRVHQFQLRACQLALGVVALDQGRVPIAEQITPRARPLLGGSQCVAAAVARDTRNT